MSLPYETATSGDRALQETQRLLSNLGCDAFGTMIDVKRGLTIVQFTWHGYRVSLEASWAGYAGALRKAQPRSSRSRIAPDDQERRFLEQAKRSVCSVLRDGVKARVTTILCGVSSFEEEFLSNILLPSGERVFVRIRNEKLLAPPAEVR